VEACLSLKPERGTFVSSLHLLVMWLMAGYLLADMLAGASIIYLGLDLKVSLLYKMPLFALLVLLTGRYNFPLMLSILLITAMLMFGPIVSYYNVLRLDILLADFAYAVKITMPMVVLGYFYVMSKLAPEWSLSWIKKILWSGFFILMINFLFGAMGLGNATYKLDTEGETGAGSTGFMMAGNELGPAFLLFFGYVLHHAWNHMPRLAYAGLAIITVLCGVLVATKTTMLASLILIFMVPIVNERQHLYRLTWLKLKIFLPVIITAVTIIILIFDILESIGLLDRIMFFYEKRGLIMIIWSGRDQFIMDLIQIYMHQSSLFEQFFGQGSAIGLKHIYGKSGAEVDIVDTLTWFGFFGVMLCCCFYLFTLKVSARFTTNKCSLFAPVIFLINSLLLLLSVLSGHIWMSGTLGIAVGVLNSLLWFESKNVAS
jgi:hypothetical protein